MKQKVVVLGAGRVGKAIASDLSEEFDVTSADINRDALQSLSSRYRVNTRVTDLGNSEDVSDAVRDADLVISAVPGHMGFNTLRTVIEQRKDIVDISFFAEDAFGLDELARLNEVTAAVDCGLAPGIPDFLAGFFAAQMQIQDFDFMVGGLHFDRTGPDQYLPTFSPSDVWEEYTRPARYVRDGKMITMPALSEPELVEFQIGGHVLVLEAFNTDGLRSLIRTMAGRIPNMKEKTLRFPGHIAYIKKLQETGTPWTPDAWKPGDDEAEFTLMRITIRGFESGQEKNLSYTLFAAYDKEARISSMARTTGYTCAGVARCVLDGTYKRAGISPPSYIGASPQCLDRIFAHLKERNIVLESVENDAAG
ncbi:MAG: saccharopine dehydrogenase NADP-binding domain-containing protein [Acidobacteriota bacterium]|nr:saccharopine dehydrogenase NADP-binding domain-containing protein [Acidobacteriota bacterium]